MADVNIDHFGDHNKIDSHPDDTGETIPLNPRGAIGRSTLEPEREQETLFGRGKAHERRLTDFCVDSLYKALSKHYSRTSDTTHYDNFRREGKRLYVKGRYEPLTSEDGKLRTFG